MTINQIGLGLNAYVDNPGTFTPILRFGGGTTGITYSTQSGHFRQTGKTIFFAISLVLTSKGSSTGAATIAGLPANAIVLTDPGQIIACGVTAVTLVGGSIFGSIASSATTINIYGNVSGSGVTGYADTNFANNSEIYMSGSYLIA